MIAKDLKSLLSEKSDIVLIDLLSFQLRMIVVR